MTLHANGLLFAVVLALGGCTTVMYGGDRLPSSQVAMLSVEDTRIDAIDGSARDDSRFTKYELRPGPHVISFRFQMTDQGALQTTYVYSNASIPLCFNALPGRRYIAAGRLNPGGKWSPEILDEQTTRPVSAWRPAAYGSCRR